MKTHFRKNHITTLFIALLACLPVASWAQQMNYQGRLTDPDGDPLIDGQRTVIFSIYDAAGTKVWGPFKCDGGAGDGHALKADLVDGRFNVVIGPMDTGEDNGGTKRLLTAAFDTSSGAPRFLGIKPDGPASTEISPRQQILAAPTAVYANHAKSADTAASATTADTATHASTADTLLGTIENATSAKNIMDTDRKLHVSSTATLGGPGTGVLKFKPNLSPGLILETTAGGESAGFSINGNTAVLWNPGDTGLLNIYDEDDIDNQDKLGASPPDLFANEPAFAVGDYGMEVRFARYITGTTPNEELKMHQAVGSLQEEQPLRIVRGNVDQTGSIDAGGGFTVNRVSIGKYRVTFGSPFGDVPTVTANGFKNSADTTMASISTITTTYVDIQINDGDFQVIEDSDFTFIAIGPR